MSTHQTQATLQAARKALQRFLDQPSDRPVPLVIGAGILTCDRGGSRVATFLLWDEPGTPFAAGLPYRAMVAVDGADGGPAAVVVERIESQCPSCFGTGVLSSERRPCDTCGATGWGTTDVLAKASDIRPELVAATG